VEVLFIYINKKEVSKDNKQQVKGLLYEEEQINKAFGLLNTILISSRPQVKAMDTIFNILENPIPFTSLDEIETK
jgi:hypothetical protein